MRGWQESGILGLGTEDVERGRGKAGGGMVERCGGGFWVVGGFFKVGKMRGLEGEIGWLVSE